MATKKRGKAPDFSDDQLAILRSAADELAAIKKITTQRAMGFALGVEQQTAGRFWKGRGAIGVTTANRLVQPLGYANVYEFFDKKRKLQDDVRHTAQVDPKHLGELSPEQLDAMRWVQLPSIGVALETIVRVNDFYGRIKRKASWWAEQYLHAKNETETAAPNVRTEETAAEVIAPRRRRRVKGS